MKTSILKVVMALAMPAIVLSSCIKSSDPPPPATPSTYISMMHLAPTGPLLDVFFDAKKVSTTAFGPGNVTPVYNAVDKGFFSIKLKKANADSLVAQLPAMQYDSLNYYTVLLYNTTVNGDVNAARIKEDFTDVLAGSNNAYYRFFHASPNTGAVDVYISNTKAESSRVHIDNLMHDPFNKFAATSANFHNVEIRLAGTSTVIATLAGVDMRAGNAYTFYLKGLEGGTGTNQLSLDVLRASQ